MSFPQNLVLWLHLAFVVFTIGPVTLAIMSTPRYIRHRDVKIVRYLSRITFIFAIGTLGVLIAGMALASMISVDGKWWVIVSATLYVVALLLLALIMRDQRKAIKALDEAAVTTPSAEVVAADSHPSSPAKAAEPAEPADAGPAPAPDIDAAAGQVSAATASHVATVERGRIAMTGGVVSLIWLVILVLMVWH
jgi:hypothetical protein